MGRRLRTRLDLLIPSVEKHVEARQYSSMLNRTAKRGLRHFHAGDAVLARTYGKGQRKQTSGQEKESSDSSRSKSARGH